MTETTEASSGRWIDIPSFDGKTLGAYLALPPATPRNRPAPGMVVLQEIWGVNAHIRAVADQYASDGYVVLAPDLFWRMKPRVDLGYDEAGSKEAYGYRRSIDLDLADKDIAATVGVLEQMKQVAGGIGVVGYCMGGMLAYRAAARAGIDCAVCYYGGGIAQQLDIAASITVPMALHFGAKDAHITPDQVAAIEATLAGRSNVRIDIYPPADHGFNCWGRPSYHQQSAALAHGRSLAFFATHLGVQSAD
ncbi:MAG: dienelactone hydrolase family protein [Burkholderiaceae bacterium]